MLCYTIGMKKIDKSILWLLIALIGIPIVGLVLKIGILAAPFLIFNFIFPSNSTPISYPYTCNIEWCLPTTPEAWIIQYGLYICFVTIVCLAVNLQIQKRKK